MVDILALALGLFIYIKPERVIEFQRQFYRSINWNMEPISMAKEISNTRLMGLFLMFVVMWCAIYFFTR